MLKYLNPMPSMPPPPRTARPPKRPFVEDDVGVDATDGEWTPQKSKSPAPPRAKAAKTSPIASKVKPGHTEITAQINNYYISERGHQPLSGRWFQEKSKLPEFWRDIKKYVALSTMKQRLSISVSVDDIYQSTSMPKTVTRKKASTSSKPILEITPLNATAQGTTTTQLCQDCGAEYADGRLTCDSCLAQEDDGMADTTVFKSEAKAENELPERPLGVKGDPIKLEDDIKFDESDSEDEEKKLATTPTITKEEMPTLITLDDGTQFVMINGIMRAVKSAVKMGLET